MWVKHYRKHLPRLGDNTSNRVERMFWTLKKSIQDTFMTLPPTVTAAVHLIQFADKRLEEKYLFATNKSTVIFDSNEKITELNVEASTVLNDRGCALFYAAQKRMEDRKVKFEMVEDGVVEQFSEESKSYQTSERICNCTFFFDHQAPCSHILFIRTELFPDDIFSPDLFHKRYHRPLNVLANLQDPQEVEQTDPVNEEASRVEPLDTFEQEEEVALSDKQKYKLVTPIVMRIGNLIACHPTKKFLQYLDALNELERRVRRGQNFMMHIHNILATIDESEDESGNDEVAELDEEQIGDSCDAHLLDDGGDGGDVREAGDIGGRADDAMSVVDIDVNHNIVFANDSQDTVIQDEFYQEEVLDQTSETSIKRKFDLAFKVGLKTKGRPKKKCKQFSFNKTVADRKKSKQDKAKKAVLVEKVAKKKVAKKTASKNKKKKDFLDDSSSEEFISDKELVDDSSDDDLDVSDESQDTEVMFKCSICGQSISPDYSAPYCGICKSVFHQNCEDDYGCVKCSN